MTIQKTDHEIDSPDGQLFARRWQNEHGTAGKPVIVLLHDSLGSVDLWRDLPEMLVSRTGLPAAAYDRPGFGRSQARHGSLPYDFIRTEAHGALSAVRNALGITRMVLLGHSVGGGMAISAGAALGSDVEAIVTMSAQSFVEVRTIEGVAKARKAFQDPTQLQRLARYHGDKARWIVDAWADTWLAPDFASWSLDGDLPLVRCPILALHGGCDEYGSEAHPQRIAALAGSPTDVVVLDGIGHLPHREKPERVVELIATFLKQHVP